MQDLDHDAMIRVLEKTPEGFLAMCDDGRPYCLPFGYVLIDNSVYISLFPQGRKWTCLQKNPQVCFTVFAWNDDHSAWSSVAIDGRLELVTDMDIIRRVVRANMLKLGIDPSGEYFEKRMTYYEQTLDNPKALKITKIITGHMGGKTMQSMAGR